MNNGANDQAGHSMARTPKSMKSAEDGYYAYYYPGPHGPEAVRFFRECVGEESFSKIAGNERFAKYPYVAAKLFLSREDWNRYVWIEHHGTLEGFEKR